MKKLLVRVCDEIIVSVLNIYLQDFHHQGQRANDTGMSPDATRSPLLYFAFKEGWRVCNAAEPGSQGGGQLCVTVEFCDAWEPRGERCWGEQREAGGWGAP